MKSKSYLTLPLVVLTAFSLLACGGSSSDDNSSPNPNPNPNPDDNPPLAEGGGYVSDLDNSQANAVTPPVTNPPNALWSFVLDNGEVWGAYGNTDESGKTTWGGLINGAGTLDPATGTIELQQYSVYGETSTGIYMSPVVKQNGSFVFTVGQNPAALTGGDLLLPTSVNSPLPDVTYPIVARGLSNFDPTAVASYDQLKKTFVVEDGFAAASFEIDLSKNDPITQPGTIIGFYDSEEPNVNSCMVMGSLKPEAGKNYFTVTLGYVSKTLTYPASDKCRYAGSNINGIALIYNDGGADRLLIMAKGTGTGGVAVGKVFFGAAQ